MKETNFKQSLVGLIPHDWEVTPLGNLGEVQMCKRIFSYQTTEMGEIPFYKIGTLGKDPDAFISQQLFEEYKRRFNFPLKGELLISAAGTIGRTIEYDGADCYYQDSNIIWLRNDESKVSNRFLAKVFKIIKWQSQDGGTISRLYNSNFRATSFSHPNSLLEQEKIAGVLSDVDELIATTETLLQKKRDIKQGTMQQLLSGKRRLPGFTAPWVEELLGKNIIVGKGNSLQAKDFIRGNIPVIAGGQSYAGFHNFANVKLPSITISASGAYAGYVWYHSYPVMATDCSVISNIDNFDLRFIYYWLKYHQEIIYKLQTGGAQPHVYPRHIASLLFFYPSSLTEQNAIAKVLADMDAEIDALEENLAKYKAIREAMMQQLLTGKIRLI